MPNNVRLTPICHKEYSKLIMKTTSGFTVVEMIVVISLIAILAAVTIFAYNGSQKDGRDSTRSSMTSVISEALEKYYDANGEYPSVASLANNGGVTGQTVATKLGISTDDLKMPQLPSGATNPLTSTNPPTNDNITYTASSVTNNTACQTDPNGGCDQFTLQYISESTGSTVTIQSHHSGRSS